MSHFGQNKWRCTTTNKLFYQFQDTHPNENQYLFLLLAKNNIAMKKFPKPAK
jgi:hypothetical protein